MPRKSKSSEPRIAVVEQALKHDIESSRARVSRRGKKPAGDLPVSGPGWGGSAKGKGNGKPRYQFTAAGPGRGHVSEAGEDRRARDAALAEEMRGVLMHIARKGEHETNRMNASKHLLDRIEGMPIARKELTGKDGDPLFGMTQEQLDARLAQLLGKDKT